MLEVLNLIEISKGDILLILDSEKRIRGIDKVLEIDYDKGIYSYLNLYGQEFNGNIKFYLNTHKIYLVDENVYKYSNRKLDSKLLQIESVFENLYGENLGSFIRASLIKMADFNFNFRMKLVDFIESYESDLYIIRWDGDTEVGYSKEDTNKSKRKIRKVIEKQLTYFQNLILD